MLAIIDQQLFLFFNQLPHSPGLDSLAMAISGIGNAGIIWVIMALFLFFREERRGWSFFTPFLTAGLVAAAASEIILKPFIGRMRPAAFILDAIVVGFFLYPFIRSYLLESTTVTAAALLIGGIFLWLIELLLKKQQASKPLTLKSSAGIGVFQSLAVIPGVSRAAATIVGGMTLGLTRKDAVEFSFLLAVPTMAAATGLDLVKQGATFTGGEFGLLLVGMAVSWVTAIFAVRYFLAYVSRNTLIPFAIYRILLALAFFLFAGA